MQVEITTRHYDPSERVKTYLENEVGKFEKFLNNILSCKLVLEKTKEGDLVEITLHVPGKDLFVSEVTDDMIKSIDFAVEKMIRQLKKFKGKRYNK
jgi:putative sigma-54 modulation protein